MMKTAAFIPTSERLGMAVFRSMSPYFVTWLVTKFPDLQIVSRQRGRFPDLIVLSVRDERSTIDKCVNPPAGWLALNLCLYSPGTILCEQEWPNELLAEWANKEIDGGT